MDELQQTLRIALRDFFAAIASGDWRGREREAVSHFAFGYLLTHCRPGGVLKHPAQIGVEVAVPGVPGLNPKPQVCKDLVIWGRPGETCWDREWRPTNAPLAILEWKCHRTRVAQEHSPHDLEWLVAFTRRWPSTVGYVVRLSLTSRARRLDAARVFRGVVEDGWLSSSGSA